MWSKERKKYSLPLSQFCDEIYIYKLKSIQLMEKKQFYEKPSLKVVVLKQTGMLMTSGPVGASIPGTFTEEDLSRELDLSIFYSDTE